MAHAMADTIGARSASSNPPIPIGIHRRHDRVDLPRHVWPPGGGVVVGRVLQDLKCDSHRLVSVQVSAAEFLQGSSREHRTGTDG